MICKRCGKPIHESVCLYCGATTNLKTGAANKEIKDCSHDETEEASCFLIVEQEVDLATKRQRMKALSCENKKEFSFEKMTSILIGVLLSILIMYVAVRVVYKIAGAIDGRYVYQDWIMNMYINTAGNFFNGLAFHCYPIYGFFSFNSLIEAVLSIIVEDSFILILSMISIIMTFRNHKNRNIVILSCLLSIFIISFIGFLTFDHGDIILSTYTWPMDLYTYIWRMDILGINLFSFLSLFLGIVIFCLLWNRQKKKSKNKHVKRKIVLKYIYAFISLIILCGIMTKIVKIMGEDTLTYAWTISGSLLLILPICFNMYFIIKLLLTKSKEKKNTNDIKSIAYYSVCYLCIYIITTAIQMFIYEGAFYDFISEKSKYFLYPILYQFNTCYLVIGLINALLFAIVKKPFIATEMVAEPPLNEKEGDSYEI